MTQNLYLVALKVGAARITKEMLQHNTKENIRKAIYKKMKDGEASTKQIFLLQALNQVDKNV